MEQKESLNSFLDSLDPVLIDPKPIAKFLYKDGKQSHMESQTDSSSTGKSIGTESNASGIKTVDSTSYR